MYGNEHKSTYQRNVIKRRLQGNPRSLLVVLLLVTIPKVIVQRRRYSLHDFEYARARAPLLVPGSGEFSDEDISKIT